MKQVVGVHRDCFGCGPTVYPPSMLLKNLSEVEQCINCKALLIRECKKCRHEYCVEENDSSSDALVRNNPRTVRYGCSHSYSAIGATTHRVERWRCTDNTSLAYGKKDGEWQGPHVQGPRTAIDGDLMRLLHLIKEPQVDDDRTRYPTHPYLVYDGNATLTLTMTAHVSNIGSNRVRLIWTLRIGSVHKSMSRFLRSRTVDIGEMLLNYNKYVRLEKFCC